jgi:hypothetical protein
MRWHEVLETKIHSALTDRLSVIMAVSHGLELQHFLITNVRGTYLVDTPQALRLAQPVFPNSF